MKSATLSLAQDIKQLDRFNNYHSFQELGIYGLRDNIERESIIATYDLKGKTVLDYGCNLGKTTLMAKSMGASHVYGIDIMPDTITLSQNIAKALGIQARFEVIDLNQSTFDQKIKKLINSSDIDITFFFSIYGTKEFHNRDKVFDFIIQSTKSYMFVEGHYMESWQIYAKRLLSYTSTPLSFKFAGYLRDSVQTKDCVMRPFFVIQKGYSNRKSIVEHIQDLVQKQHKLSIGIEGLAGSGKSFYTQKLVEILKQKFGDKTILVIDDLNASDGARYVPIAGWKHKILYGIKKYLLKQNIKTLHEAYKLYDIVIVSDYRLRTYINTIDIVISMRACDDSTRKEKIHKRGNRSDAKQYATKTIHTSNFAAKHYFVYQNTYCE